MTGKFTCCFLKITGKNFYADCQFWAGKNCSIEPWNPVVRLPISTTKPSTMKFTTLLLLALIPGISDSENFLINSNKLFNFAEAAYPNYFDPAGVETTTLDEYLVRYYLSTDTY